MLLNSGKLNELYSSTSIVDRKRSFEFLHSKLPCFGKKSEENETILRTETSGHCKSKGE